jgi:hypothetical protein
MSGYETKNRRNLQQFEIDAFQGDRLALDEYANKVLPRFITAVDQMINKNCNDMAERMDKECQPLGLKRIMVGITETGATWTPPAKPGTGRFSYLHMAPIVIIQANLAPAIVMDAIGMWLLGGQTNVETGAYYRWPARTWAATKSVHYGGIAGRAVWHRPGAMLAHTYRQKPTVGTPY